VTPHDVINLKNDVIVVFDEQVRALALLMVRRGNRTELNQSLLLLLLLQALNK
jgi:hypothetical protein